MTETAKGSADIASHRRFRVHDWLVEPDQGRLSQGDESVRIEPKVMEVLVYLAGRRGEVVTREELEREVWRGALVGYDAVTSTVIKLRKALGDSARNPSMIRTIPKRGYQLIAAVGPADEGPGGNDSAEAAVRPKAKRVLYAVATLLVLAGIGFSLIRMGTTERDQAPEAGLPPAPSIVVLPFEDLSDESDQDSFSDGITEDIITDLSGLSGLLVIASNTAFSYKGRQVTPKQIAAELGVGYVLDGSIRRHGDSVRVNAQLVNADSGFQEWAGRLDQKITEIFAVQDEITNSIVTELQLKLTPKEKKRMAQRMTNNLTAYKHFREGQRLGQISSRQSNLLAQDAYRRAIEEDPSYGRAYGALAFNLAFSYRRGWSDAPMLTLDRALELAKKAVELDSSVPQTHWSLGYVHFMRKEYVEAEAAANQSVAIAPNYADGYGLLARINNSLGNAETVIRLINKGMELNPFFTWDYPFNLGIAYYTLGRYEEAIEVLEEARTRNENVVPVRLYLAASYVHANRLEDAEWEAEEIQVLSSTDTLLNLRNTLPIVDKAHLEKLISDLRLAGLPEE
jgi:TolB-like protein/DNA-binding winged helix-turn-helix (wHTH) protein/Flp pilus assembly protein TadD